MYELSNKEFKIILLKKFSELQEHTDRQLHKTRKTMQAQNEKFNKEIDTTKKLNQTNRNTRAEEYNDWTENSIENCKSTLDGAEGKIKEKE